MDMQADGDMANVNVRRKPVEFFKASSPASLIVVSPWAIVLALIVAGCSDTSRQGIEGQVTLNGVPVADGEISFMPQQGTESPTAGGTIVHGAYRVDSVKGVLPGQYRVEIRGLRKTGRKVQPPVGDPVDEVENIIPANYNDQSVLTAEVTSDGPNRFDFELKSKVKLNVFPKYLLLSP